jgi:hypothetical protein
LVPIAPRKLRRDYDISLHNYREYAENKTITDVSILTALLCAYSASGLIAFLAGPSLKVLKFNLVNMCDEDDTVRIRACPSGDVFAVDIRIGRRSLVK